MGNSGQYFSRRTHLRSWWLCWYVSESTWNIKTAFFHCQCSIRLFSRGQKNLFQGTVIIGGDFAENYHFLVQDAAQGFHWSNDQATIHPFIVYYKSETNELVHLSVAFVSDELVHNTKAVYIFQEKLIDHLKTLNIQIDKILYFSDGSAAQYKNRKNLINLVFHKEDFGMPADWHFFATSHGKGKLYTLHCIHNSYLWLFT